MMKIGIIVFGEFREFEIARKSWGVFELANCDFYFSTWSKSHQKHEVLNIDIYEEINENRPSDPLKPTRVWILCLLK